MADLKNCIDAAVADGHMSREIAEEAKTRYDDLVSDFRGDGKLSWHESQVRAAERVEKDLERDRARRRRMRVFQGLAQDRIRARLAAAPGEADKAALAVLEFDPKLRHVGENVAARHASLRGFAFSLMSDFVDRYRSKAGGLRRETAGMEDVIAALFGETASPQAKALADGIQAARDYLRGRHNAAGGNIVQRKDWGWVQHHDRAAVARVSKETWTDFVLDRIDDAKMVYPDGQPMGLRAIRAAVEGAYDTIVTGGLDEVVEAGALKFGSPISKRVHHRELVFKGSKAWLEYQQRFGSADMFSAITGEIDRLARETALIEVMGPSPRATLDLLRNLIATQRGTAARDKTGKAAARLAEKMGGRNSYLESVYDQVSGGANIPADAGWARVSQSNRNLVTSARLGSAIFASLSDAGTLALTASMNGVPHTRLLREFFHQLNPGDKAHRRMAARAGLIAETWIGHAVGAQRILGEVTGTVSTAKVADTTLRLSGLNAWTDAGRAAFKVSLIGHLTDNASKAWGDLDKATRRGMQRYGIDEADWNLYRSTSLWTDPETGADLIRPEDVYRDFTTLSLPLGEKDARFKTAQKFNDFISTEATFAVVSPTARSRALTTGGFQPGTFWGEVVRNLTLFRSFTVAFTYLHLSRALAERGLASRGRYLAYTTIGMTLGGAVAEMASDVLRGKDPREMDEKFWAAAVMRGGALGPLGDFLYSDVSRHGNGLAEAILGPIIGGQVVGGFTATIGNVRELIQKGEARSVTPEVRRFVEGLLPGNSLWFARIAVERLIKDELETMADADTPQRFRRMEQRARRDFDQRYWWRPGHALPDRLPDAGAAVGAR